MDDQDSNVTVFPGKPEQATSAGRSQQNGTTPQQVVALLTSCLALVRPVGLTDDNARDWLRVAAGEVAYLPLDILRQACAEARRTTTHHAQIIPAIIKAGDELLSRKRYLDDYTKPIAALPAPEIVPPALEEVAATIALIEQAGEQFNAKQVERWHERRLNRPPHHRTKVDPDAPRSAAEMLARRDAAEKTDDVGA